MLAPSSGIPRRWNVADSAEVYAVRAWGSGYFSIGDNGNIAVTPAGPQGGTIDMKELTGGSDFHLSASVGASVHPAAAPDAKALVERAFQRMLEARGAGGDRILVEAEA